jgi:hypothetical protein
MDAGTVWIVVAADEHPELDDWVKEHAEAEAAHAGVTIVSYLGREDMLPAPRPPDLCCHVFIAHD